MADRCNGSATTANISSPVFPSPLIFRDSSSFPPYLMVTLPASLLPSLSFTLSVCLLPPSSFLSTTTFLSTHRVNVLPLSPSVILRPSSFPLSSAFSPTTSFQPSLVSSQRCTTHVLTEQRTSDLRGESVQPSSARATLSRRGSFRRKHLALLSRLSRRLSSRLETVRCAGDPGTIHLEHPDSLVAMARRFTTRWTQDSRVQIKVLSFSSFRSTPFLVRSAAAGSF